MNTATRRLVAFVLLAVSAVVTGCGGGGDEPEANVISPEVARYRALSEAAPAPAGAASAALPG